MASWRINSRSVYTGAGACLALVGLSAFSRADPALTNATAVTPNQSVALIEGAPGGPSPSDDEEAEAVRQPVEGRPGASTLQAWSVRSKALLRRDAEVIVGRTQDESVPWYRTGIGALGAVLALVGGALWVIRRWVPSLRVSDGGLVKVVARAAVSPKHHVALLRFGRRFVLVGMAGERISTLAEVTDTEEVAELVARVGGASEFEGWLGRERTAFESAWDEETVDAVEGRAPVARPRPASLHASALTQLKNRLRSLQSK